jgi:hypothetical protein
MALSMRGRPLFLTKSPGRFHGFRSESGNDRLLPARVDHEATGRSDPSDNQFAVSAGSRIAGGGVIETGKRPVKSSYSRVTEALAHSWPESQAAG